MNNYQGEAIYQLHIFSKDTDAQASIRGFEYQKLKTLVSWIDTNQQPDSKIYCEYQDDIMEVGPNENSVTFRQIKLYSSKFSFKSSEIKKAIANFFMLYCNQAYAGKQIQFIFETNSSVSPSETILQDWLAYQGHLADDILTRCRDEVNTILLEYIEKGVKDFVERTTSKIKTQQKKLDATTNENQKAAFQAAIEQLQLQIEERIKVASSYGTLDDKVLTAFVQSIRWEFLSVRPDDAFIALLDQIQKQLVSLPYGILTNETEALIARLHWFVSQTSIQEDSGDRFLMFAHLENIILTRDENNDKWYADIREQWQQEGVDYFLVAEFYEVVNICHHCRSKLYLYNDTELWVQILERYYSLPDTPHFARRKAAYEICMLIIKPDSITQGQIPTVWLGDRVAYIHDYFGDIESYTNVRDIEDAISLLTIVLWELSNQESLLTEEDWRNWINRLNILLDKQISTSNPNYRCGLIECKINLIFTTDLIEDIDKTCKRVIGYTNEILELLPKGVELKNRTLFVTASL